MQERDCQDQDPTLRYVHHMDGREPDAEELAIPGLSGAFMKVMAVSPSDGSVIVRLRGLSKDPKAEYQPATKESLSVEVTKKPLISLVWAGFYVMMAGAILAFVKRTREARRAALEHEKTPQAPEPVSPAGAGFADTHPLDDSVGGAPVVGRPTPGARSFGGTRSRGGSSSIPTRASVTVTSSSSFGVMSV